MKASQRRLLLAALVALVPLVPGCLTPSKAPVRFDDFPMILSEAVVEVRFGTEWNATRMGELARGLGWANVSVSPEEVHAVAGQARVTLRDFSGSPEIAGWSMELRFVEVPLRLDPLEFETARLAMKARHESRAEALLAAVESAAGAPPEYGPFWHFY